MKILLILLLTTTFAHASMWKVKSKNQVFFLVNENDQTYQIISEGGSPKFIKEVKLNNNFILALYNAGTAGTSTPITIHRAVVLNKTTLKYLGDYPYKYIGSNAAQPQWRTNGKVLSISDQESGLEKTIEIN